MMNPRIFAALTGILVAGTGIAGIIAMNEKKSKPRKTKSRQSTAKAQSVEIAGAIPTNELFNWVRLGIGATGLACAMSEKSSVVYNRSVAVSYIGMAAMGLTPKLNTMFGLMPLHGGNVALHAGTAIAELLTEKEMVGDLVEFAKEEGMIGAVVEGAVQQLKKAAPQLAIKH